MQQPEKLQNILHLTEREKLCHSSEALKLHNYPHMKDIRQNKYAIYFSIVFLILEYIAYLFL